MQREVRFSWLLLPLSVLIFLAFALFVERSGISYTIQRKPAYFLNPNTHSLSEEDHAPESGDASCLVMKYSSSVVKDLSFKTVAAALDSMKVPYHITDIQSDTEINLESYENVIITFVELSALENRIDEILGWVESGGNLLFAIRPDTSDTLSNIQHAVGLDFVGDEYIKTSGVEFLTEILPGTAGMRFGLDFMDHTSLAVDISDDAELHVISAEEIGLPILWEVKLGDGKVLFINSDQFIDKSSRGLIGAAYSMMQDVVIYPVINASVFYIDDFPSPIPEGKNEAIFRQFNRDIRGFYLNVWWPDMQEIKDKYNLQFTTVIIETYNHNLKPPFEYTIGQGDIFQYFGGFVLRDSGEIGLHGFNHVPFCTEEDKINKILAYPAWDTREDMQASLSELQNFSASQLPGQPFAAYVPPSNILCDEARGWLPEVLSDLKVIASVYLPDAEVPAYVQEFEEANDGIIEFPRIVAGYNPDSFARWAAANEIWLHFTAGHFTHPDDVLDSYRTKGESWPDLRESLDEYLLWMYSSMPGVRNLTSTEGAMAVQRFTRLTPDYACLESECYIVLDGFYDEGWLMMRTERMPSSITKGEITQVAEHLYLIKVISSDFEIGFEE